MTRHRSLLMDKKEKKVTTQNAVLILEAGALFEVEDHPCNPPKTPSQKFFAVHFFDNPLKRRSTFPPTRKALSGLAGTNQLYRLNSSTFYNEAKGINRNAIRYDSKCICMQERTYNLLQRATSRTRLTSRTCEPAKSSRTGIKSRSSLS